MSVYLEILPETPGMTVSQMRDWLRNHSGLKSRILALSDEPRVVDGIEFPSHREMAVSAIRQILGLDSAAWITHGPPPRTVDDGVIFEIDTEHPMVQLFRPYVVQFIQWLDSTPAAEVRVHNRQEARQRVGA